jgi:formylglycine-generating enzyme required for sulfatase activity
VKRDASGNFSAGTITANLTGNATTATSATSATTANNFSGSLSGDVTGTQGATVVANVGGQSAANVAGGASAANAATSANTADTIVKRDASGNFSAGTITANLSGNATSATTAATLAIPPGMALIPTGFFTMGNSIGDYDITDASPTNVYVSAFYMDVNLVSYSQWQSVYFWATNHGYSFFTAGSGKAANQPVQTLYWYDAVKWCNARSQQAGKTPVYYTDSGSTQVFTNASGTSVYANWAASGYRLPTEAEWEKAARGGLSGQRFPWGNVITENLANYYGCVGCGFSYDFGPTGYNAAFTNGVGPYTSPVGSFAPNGYGLYDMAGNVQEWCWDWYAAPPYPSGSPYLGGYGPVGPATGTYRVVRGGVWNNYATYLRCAYRGAEGPLNTTGGDYGFRCAKGL